MKNRDMAYTWIPFRLRRSNPSRFAWESQTPDNLHLEDLDEDRIKGAVAYGVDRGRMPASAMTESTWGLLDKFAMIRIIIKKDK